MATSSSSLVSVKYTPECELHGHEVRMSSFCWVNVPLPNPILPSVPIPRLLELSNWLLPVLPVLLSFPVLHSFFISFSSFSFLRFFFLLFLVR